MNSDKNQVKTNSTTPAEEERIDTAAKEILAKYKEAFEELAK